MALQDILAAKIRPETETGGNQAGRLRRAGLLPAIFYGQGEENKILTLDYKEFKTAFLNTEGNRSLFTLDIEGLGRQIVMLKEYQVHPIKRTLMHADFMKINEQEQVVVSVPLILVGKPIGVEKGGQLQQIEREVTISAKPADLPAHIEVNVSKINLGQTMRLSQITPPEKVSLVITADLSVATVAPPKGAKAAEAGENGA